jgi:topoisomerase-4 subunit B
MATKKPVSDYSESSIRVLKGLEPVKQRPGMYTRTENPLHIIQEVIDNAADEALGGNCKNIIVTQNADGSVTVEDDGRGIPVGLHPEEGVPTVEIVFTRLHAGGKFDKGKGGAYAFSGGLHGVGVSVTNALSKRLEITVWRKEPNGTGLHHLVFENGDVVEPLNSVVAPRDAKKSGTRSRSGRTPSTSTPPPSRRSSCNACCAPRPCCCRACRSRWPTPRPAKRRPGSTTTACAAT